MSHTHFSKLFTPEGLIVGAVTLVLTLILCRPHKPKAPPAGRSNNNEGLKSAILNSDDPQGASRSVHFTDHRTPHEVRWALEREHMTIFEPAMIGDRLEFHGKSKCNGLPCTFRLVFESADRTANEYSLHIRMSWEQTPPEHHDHHRKSAGSWFDLWCRNLEAHPALPMKLPDGRYRERVVASLSAESDLTDVPAIQRAILRELKNGATFSTAHKEGGTNIGHARGHFFRSDYGESDERETFPDDASFLAFLRRFYDWETSRSVAPAKVPDEVAWRLILRLLDPP